MSILDVVVSPERVLVAVDTAVTNLANGRRSEGSKMVPLLHLNAVFAMRGPQDFLANVYAACAMHPANLDQLLEAMPLVLQHCYERQFPKSATRSTFARVQFVVAGWSPARQEMVAMDYRLDEFGGKFKLRKEIESWMLAPSEGLVPPTTAPTAADLVHIAGQQARHASAAKAGEGVGGRLIVAELTRCALAMTGHTLLA